MRSQSGFCLYGLDDRNYDQDLAGENYYRVVRLVKLRVRGTFVRLSCS